MAVRRDHKERTKRVMVMAIGGKKGLEIYREAEPAWIIHRSQRGIGLLGGEKEASQSGTFNQHLGRAEICCIRWGQVVVFLFS